MSKSVPYANASAGSNARKEITKLLTRFGCEQVGFMDDFEHHAVTLAFRHRGRAVQLRASAEGWATMWLKENPWNGRRSIGRDDWHKRALGMGLVAVNSILRDWVKGQITAVESGLLTFEEVFMAHMMLPDGRRVVDHVGKFIEAKT